jgi:DNA-binding PadR family transcriptional regulator
MSHTTLRRKTDLAGCPCTGGNLDKLIQPAILAVLAEGPMHGYGLAERIGEMPGFSGQKPDTSGIYRYLKGMKERNLVVSAWDASRTGPAKKTFEITAQGRQCLRRWENTLVEYRREISALLHTVQRAAKKMAGDD